MTITTSNLSANNWVNSTITQDFKLNSHNGIVRIRSNTGVTTLSKNNGIGTYLTIDIVAQGETGEAKDLFKGDYRITGTDFNFEYAD